MPEEASRQREATLDQSVELQKLLEQFHHLSQENQPTPLNDHSKLFENEALDDWLSHPEAEPKPESDPWYKGLYSGPPGDGGLELTVIEYSFEFRGVLAMYFPVVFHKWMVFASEI